MIEVFKNINGLTPPILENFLTLRQNRYNLRNFRELDSHRITSVRYGSESISYKAPQLWQSLSRNIKNSSSLEIFKSEMKTWEPKCPCRLCITYLQQIGFINLQNSSYS